MNEVSNQHYRLNSPTAVAELVGDEVVAINLDTGNYYGMPGVASEIWALILERRAGIEIVDLICSRYSGSREKIENHVFEFIQKLLKEELIIPDSETLKPNHVSQATISGFRSDALDTEFKSPELQRYTDMQEFLLVDPIHEVDVTDWPTPGRRNRADDTDK